jgi:hypothetical protein
VFIVEAGWQSDVKYSTALYKYCSAINNEVTNPARFIFIRFKFFGQEAVEMLSRTVKKL